MTACRHVEWKVPFAAGKLRAQVWRKGSDKIFATETIETTGKPAAITMETEWPLSKSLKADNTDTALVTVRLVDGEGRTVQTASPDSSIKLDFALSGEGKIIGKGNGDPSNHEADKPESSTKASHSIFNGLARLVVQSTHKAGSIKLTASSKGLKGG